MPMIWLHVQHGIHHESEIEMEIGKSDKVRAAVTRVNQIERETRGGKTDRVLITNDYK